MAASRVALLLAVLILTGCAGPRFATTAARDAEAAWLGLHALDTLQTMQIARYPACLHESNPLAAALYGSKHPSTERVVITNVLLGTAHVYASAWLDRQAEARGGPWRAARFGAQVLSIGGTGLAVGNNFARGVKPVGRLHCDHSR